MSYCIAFERAQRWSLRKFVQNIKYCEIPLNGPDSIRFVTTPKVTCSTKQAAKAVRATSFNTHVPNHGTSSNGDQRRVSLMYRRAGNQTRDVHTREALIADEHSLPAAVSAVKHGDMCGLDATNPLHARTPPPLAAGVARRNKSNRQHSPSRPQALGVCRAADRQGLKVVTSHGKLTKQIGERWRRDAMVETKTALLLHLILLTLAWLTH